MKGCIKFNNWTWKLKRQLELVDRASERAGEQTPRSVGKELEVSDWAIERRLVSSGMFLRAYFSRSQQLFIVILLFSFFPALVSLLLYSIIRGFNVHLGILYFAIIFLLLRERDCYNTKSNGSHVISASVLFFSLEKRFFFRKLKRCYLSKMAECQLCHT